MIVQIESLRTDGAVFAKLGRGESALHGWVYKIEMGEVFRYDPVQGQFLVARSPVCRLSSHDLGCGRQARPDEEVAPWQK